LNYELASLEVVSLFTNVSPELVYKSIDKKWKIISFNISIPKEEFLYAIKYYS